MPGNVCLARDRGTTVPTTTKGVDMSSGTFDDAKGRAKEATGDLTGDKDLKREGKVDRAVGKVKDKADEVGEKIKDKF